MDKRQVIAAYRRGLLTIQECAQIIGVDSQQAAHIAEGTKPSLDSGLLRDHCAAKSI